MPLSTYADANGFIDVQTLTCGQLANTYQEDANALTSWYSGWYNGLAHKHFADFKRAAKSSTSDRILQGASGREDHSRRRQDDQRGSRRRDDAGKVRVDEKSAFSGGAWRRCANLADAPASAQQTVTFLCAAPAGHVCQFAVKTGGSQMAFALPSGERKEVAGITPHADKYCVCDPGPVTADCTAPQLDHWCLGSWLDVDPGLNSENDASKGHYVAIRGNYAD